MMLSCRELRFAYGDRPVLRGVSLTIAAGKVTGLVGPNGAGKTTLLRCLAGVARGEGEICYGKRSLAALTTRERAAQRAYVAQSLEAVLPYRAGDVVAMGLAHRSALFAAPAAPASVRAVLAEVGFEPPPEQLFTRLSGGERQQVLVARALVPDAGILLLDEPTSALDLRHRHAVIAALRRRARTGATVLVSLHDLNLAALACDELVVLADGAVVASGPPVAVLTAELVRQVYGVAVAVAAHPHSGAPMVQLDPRGWA
jgi:iron complex transport system ATP-binding protein